MIPRLIIYVEKFRTLNGLNSAPENDASEICTKLIQHKKKECVVDVSEAQKLLDGLHVKITTLAD